MRNKSGVCMILFLCSIILTGCWDRIEINDLAFVMASSLDLTEQGELLGTMQIAIPSGIGSEVSSMGGASTSGGAGKNVFVTSVTGRDVEDIMQKSQERLSRRIYISHRSILLIGERLAKHGIKDVLDHFSRNPSTRLRTYVLVTKGMDARQFLKLKYPFERYPAEAIRELERSGVGAGITMRDFLRASSSEGIIPVVGVVEPAYGPAMNQEKGRSQENNKDEQLIRLSGTAIFKDFKLAGYLDDEETRGFMWLTGRMERGTISAKIEGPSSGIVSLRIRRAERKILPRVEGDKLKINVEVKGEGAIYENNTNLDLGQPQNVQLVQEALRKAIEDRIQQTIQASQKDFRADIFGFGLETHRRKAKQWKAIKNEWEMRYPEAEIDLNVHLAVQRSGMSGPPLHLKENEVDK